MEYEQISTSWALLVQPLRDQIYGSGVVAIRSIIPTVIVSCILVIIVTSIAITTVV